MPLWDSCSGCDDVFSGMLWVELYSIFRKARLTLRQKESAIFYFKGYNYKEISVIMGISENTIQTHIDRAKNKMSKVKDRGIITATVEQLGYSSLRYIMSGRR